MAGEKFALGGVHHAALVCSDIDETVEFYSGILGMPLVKTIDLPFGLGRHYFFDCGGGDTLAFFWFPDSPPAAPGIASPKGRPDTASLTSAVGSMNHIAFSVPSEMMETYRERLIAAGVDCSEIANHDNSEIGLAEELTPDVYVRSLYFQGPDGVLLEFAAWTRAFDESDVDYQPRNSRSVLSRVE